MRFLANLITFLVILLHFGFMALEMFFWNHPIGHQVFAMTPEVAASSQTLALNQGLYNGFLAAGLLWALIADKHDVKIFFLLCIVVAGVVGGLSAKVSILYIQALPACIAIILVLRTRRRQAGEKRLFS